MAKNIHGLLGAFIGTIGPVTGYMRNGRNILRSSNSSVKDRQTSLQQTQREKLHVCTRFAKAFSGTGFLNKSFSAYGHGGSGYNRLISALMSRALIGSSPDIGLDYRQVLVSQGKLPAAQDTTAVRLEPGMIEFSFSDNSDHGIANANDHIILVAYAPEMSQAVFTLCGGLRKDCRAILNVQALTGHHVETWIGFLSDDEANASDSVWTGSIRL